MRIHRYRTHPLTCNTCESTDIKQDARRTPQSAPDGLLGHVHEPEDGPAGNHDHHVDDDDGEQLLVGVRGVQWVAGSRFHQAVPALDGVA